MRCSTCPVDLPVCAGEAHPALCLGGVLIQPDPTDETVNIEVSPGDSSIYLIENSKIRSSIAFGWPAPIVTGVAVPSQSETVTPEPIAIPWTPNTPVVVLSTTVGPSVSSTSIVVAGGGTVSVAVGPTPP